MAEDARPQIYLISPPEIDAAVFPDRLAAVLDAHPVACLRLALSSGDADRVARAADAVREIAHARDVAVVIETHGQMVGPLGLDGVHLPDGARHLRGWRKELGADAIVGAFCGTTRHDGLTAGEAGADYVAFGPVRATALGDGRMADEALFAWWSEMIEVPVVAEGALTEERISSLSRITDFFGLGEEVWSLEDAADGLGRLIAAMR